MIISYPWEDRVIPVAVLLPDSSISPVDRQFRIVPLRDVPTDIDGFTLSVTVPRHSRSSFALDVPSLIRIWDYVNGLARQESHLLSVLLAHTCA
jgi:hypothetical protein